MTMIIMMAYRPRKNV